MDYRILAVLGIILVIAELFTFSFVLIFFGIAAILTSITTAIGITQGLTGQFTVFSLFSLSSIIVFRSKIRARLTKSTLQPHYIGQRVMVTKTIHAGGEGKVYYRGSEWIAFHDESIDIEPGTMVEIIGADGIRLQIKPVSSNEKSAQQNPEDIDTSKAL